MSSSSDGVFYIQYLSLQFPRIPLRRDGIWPCSSLPHCVPMYMCVSHVYALLFSIMCVFMSLSHLFSHVSIDILYHMSICFSGRHCIGRQTNGSGEQTSSVNVLHFALSITHGTCCGTPPAMATAAGGSAAATPFTTLTHHTCHIPHTCTHTPDR